MKTTLKILAVAVVLIIVLISFSSKTYADIGPTPTNAPDCEDNPECWWTPQPTETSIPETPVTYPNPEETLEPYPQPEVEQLVPIQQVKINTYKSTKSIIYNIKGKYTPY